MLGWCAAPTPRTLTVVQVASTELAFVGILPHAGYAAILKREGLAPQTPDRPGVGLITIWQCG